MKPPLNSHPTAIALRSAAMDWVNHPDTLNSSDRSARELDALNVKLLKAAQAYAHAVTVAKIEEDHKIKEVVAAGMAVPVDFAFPKNTRYTTTRDTTFTVPVGTVVVLNPPGEPLTAVVRWKCKLCKRDRFTKRCSHKCVGGYRKKHLKWEPIYG